MLKEISRRQFDAYCYVRQPLVRIMSREVAWFEVCNRKLLATIVHDSSDNDYGWVILGRDARRLFRCIDLPCQFLPTKDEAIEDLSEKIAPYMNDGKDIYPQDDELGAPNDIFQPVVPKERLHPYFKVLTEEPRFEAARNLIKEIAYSFVDVDGNYIEQFQTSGFDARLWELFLYVYLYNSGFEIDRNHNVPDYCLSYFGYECFIEAVSVGQSGAGFDVTNPKSSREIVELSKDYLPIKYGSALFSKLNKEKKYWELDHVKGKPFILAVHDYHLAAEPGLPGSMTWSRAGLFNYLYGIRDIVEFDENGNSRPAVIETPDGPIVKTEKIEQHSYKSKTIPSNFFKQPLTENISAVLFSNGATLTTFNRMGKLAGLGSQNIKMIRMGVRYNPSPDAMGGLPFSIDVDSLTYEEAWSDTVVMFHNPNALVPVNPNAFPEITHVSFDNASDAFMVIQSPNEIYSSTTVVVHPKTSNA